MNLQIFACPFLLHLLLITVTRSTFCYLRHFAVSPPGEAQPTELLFLLQQDEAERRVALDELPGRGQAHDAASHHRHIVCAERQVKGELTGC